MKFGSFSAAFVMAAGFWASSAAAQPRREWAFSVTPQLGYVWTDVHFDGSLTSPGQLTELDALGQTRGLSLGLAFACTRRYWSRDAQSAIGPIVALSYGSSSATTSRLEVNTPAERAVAERISEQLYAEVRRGTIQGGAGLTMLGGLFEWRLLIGVEFVDTRVPELAALNERMQEAFSVNTGARFRLPLSERWKGLAGINCGHAKYVSAPGGSTACVGELGAEWTVAR